MARAVRTRREGTVHRNVAALRDSPHLALARLLHLIVIQYPAGYDQVGRCLDANGHRGAHYLKVPLVPTSRRPGAAGQNIS